MVDRYIKDLPKKPLSVVLGTDEYGYSGIIPVAQSGASNTNYIATIASINELVNANNAIFQTIVLDAILALGINTILNNLPQRPTGDLSGLPSGQYVMAGYQLVKVP